MSRPGDHGNRVLTGTDRRVHLARSYVEGLEERSQRLDQLQAEMMELNWEAINLAGHCLAQQRVLKTLMAHLDHIGWPNAKLEAITSEVYDGVQSLLDRVWSCPCGHSKFDHDELGCAYLGCKPICGTQ